MIGQTLGRYRILEEVGSGGMGVVYRARDERLERDVALKVLPEGRLGDETAGKRFREEAKALSKLNHPNLVEILDVAWQPELPVQEGSATLPTASLGDRLSQLHGDLPPSTTPELIYLDQIAEQLGEVTEFESGDSVWGDDTWYEGDW